MLLLFHPLVASPRLEVIEVVADDTATSNAWGGHQTRIVRTRDGVFTVLLKEKVHNIITWHLVWRRNGQWVEVGEGLAEGGPVNLLTSPDGTLHIINWLEGLPMILSGKPDNGSLDLVHQQIPGFNYSIMPYNSAGIDKEGNICFLSSFGKKPGTFNWSYYLAEKDAWIPKITMTDYRYCYTFVFPLPGGGLKLVSNRDVYWVTRDYENPAGKGKYGFVYDAVRYWHTDRIENGPLKISGTLEELQTDQYLNVACVNSNNCAYLDTKGNMHIIYRRKGASTRGKEQVMHALFSPAGKLLRDEIIPDEAGEYVDIFQDKRGRFYLLDTTGRLYPAGVDGFSLETPLQLDLQGHEAKYSGFALSVPRTGTPLSNIMDVVFSTSDFQKWIYMRIVLSD